MSNKLNEIIEGYRQEGYSIGNNHALALLYKRKAIPDRTVDRVLGALGKWLLACLKRYKSNERKLAFLERMKAEILGIYMIDSRGVSRECSDAIAEINYCYKMKIELCQNQVVLPKDLKPIKLKLDYYYLILGLEFLQELGIYTSNASRQGALIAQNFLKKDDTYIEFDNIKSVCYKHRKGIQPISESIKVDFFSRLVKHVKAKNVE